MAQRLKYAELAPEGIAALRGLEHYLNTGTAVGAVLLELVRLRTSQINGCDFCEHSHVAELKKHHEPQSRIEAVSAWRDSDAFTGRERAAMAWAESVTNVAETQVPDADFAAVNQFFSGKDLADLTLAVASMNAWNRMGVAFRAEWKAGSGKAVEKPAEKTEEKVGESGGNHGEISAVGDDGGKVAED